MVLAHERRRIIHFAVTAHPTAAWAAQERSDEYMYDPGDPGPLRADRYAVQVTRTPMETTTSQKSRAGMMCSTPPLLCKKASKLQERLKAVLYVSSSAKDTDCTAKLVDVYPDGKAYNFQEGILRAQFCKGFTKKVWMRFGEVYEIPIDFKATSNYFSPGHRIRVEISSSNFPRFDRNLNAGGNDYDETKWLTALNQIHHSAAHASYVVLPVIPEG